MGTAVSIPSHVCYKTLQKSFPETLFFINLKLILVADRMRIRITSCVIILSFYKCNFFKWEIPKPQWMVNQTPFASFFFQTSDFLFPGLQDVQGTAGSGSGQKSLQHWQVQTSGVPDHPAEEPEADVL